MRKLGDGEEKELRESLKDFQILEEVGPGPGVEERLEQSSELGGLSAHPGRHSGWAEVRGGQLLFTCLHCGIRIRSIGGEPADSRLRDLGATVTWGCAERVIPGF